MSSVHQHPWNFEDASLVSAIDELPFWSAPFGQTLLDTVALMPGLKVMDIGSGLGFPALELAQRLGKTARMVALDPWRAATRRMRQKMIQYEIDNVTIINGVVETMPFESASFDLITSNNGLNNVLDWRQAWRECSRVAKNGAQMVVTENLPGTMHEFYQCLEKTLQELAVHECCPRIADHIYSKRKPIEETKAVALENGFQIVKEKHCQFSLHFLDGTSLLNHFFIRLAFLPAWKSIVPEGDQARVFRQVEINLNQMAHESGRITLTVPFVCLDLLKSGR